MKKFNLLSLLLVVIMIFGIFTGCGKDENSLDDDTDTKTSTDSKQDEEDKKDTDSDDEDSDSDVNTDGEADTDEGADTDEDADGEENSNTDRETSSDKNNSEFPEKLVAEKIGSLDNNRVKVGQGGLYYSESGKYGIITLDGKNDTGAIYDYCSPNGQFFEVVTNYASDMSDPSSLNCAGLVDANGKVIVPEQYAAISVLNEKYVKVCEVTEKTENKDEALVYYTDSSFSVKLNDGDALYKGNWYVYDVTTGKKVEGVTGTKAYSISTYGNYIAYYDDNDEKIIVNAKGEKLPDNAQIFDNGCYSIEEGSEGVVYDTNDNKLFTYDPDGYVPYSNKDEYFAASKYESGGSTYVLMDKTGKIISAKFSDYPMLYGELILSDDKLYDFSGNQIAEGTYDYVYFDEQTESCWILEKDETRSLIKEDGTVIYTNTEEGDIRFETSNFVIRNTIDSDYFYYSLKEKDFTIEGYSFAPWIIEVSGENYTSALADVISGETIIEGYNNYKEVIVDTTLYVYAENYDSGIDIYTIAY